MVIITGDGADIRSRSAARYRSGGHTKHRLLYHLVFVPKYRKRVLAGDLAARLRAVFEEACAMNDWEIHESGIQSDHLHLLLQIPPHESVSSVVQCLKGGSSRLLRAEFADLAEFVWEKGFWAAGFFAESVGQSEEKVVRRYIRKQREPDARSAR